MYDERGSVWRKWDLHVHTPSSIVQHYGEKEEDEIWEKYISDLESLPEDYSVLGINDYLFLDGYERLVKEKEENDRLENIDLLLPVVEFRIEKFAGIDFGALKRINFHVIFSNDLTIETIQSQFLNTLEQSYTLNDGEEWNRAITRASISDLGKTIKDGVPDEELKNYGSDLIEGFNNLNVNENKIIESLKRDCFNDKYLIAIGKTEWDSLKWTNASIAAKKSIINKSDIVFTAAEGVEAYQNARQKLTNQQVNNLLLDCSDAHHYSDSADKDRIGNCNTWIKADPTFQGLRQILFEPKLRVRIQEENPENTYKKIHISEITLSNNVDYPIVNQSIKLNRDLVCIIGGRGSGKSALFETVAYCFNEHKSQENPDEFGYRDSDSYGSDPFIDYYLKDGSDFDIKLDFISLDGEPLESYEANFQDKQENCSYPILYLGQNRIEYFANDPDRIHKLAYDTVLKNTSRSDELNSAEKQINEKKDDLINLNKEIEGLNRKISEFDEDSLIEEKKRIESERELLTSKEVKEIVQSFNEARKKREALKKIESLIGTIGTDEEEGDGQIQELVGSFQRRVSEPIKQVNQLIKEIDIDNVAFGLDLDPFLKQIDEIKEEIPKYDITNEYKELLSEVEKKLEGKTDLSVSYLESLRSKEESLEDKLSNLEELKEELGQKKENRYRLLNELDEFYDSYTKEYQIAIQKFSEKNEGILQSVRLEAKKEFDLEKLVKRLFTEVDRRKVKDINRFKTEFLGIEDKDSFDFVSWIQDFLDEEASLEVFTNLSVKDFEELVFEDYYNLVTNIEYQIIDDEFKPLNRLSLGQKGTVLLKFYLSSGNNCPILIDQPEDHLDNDFIYSDLVETIRKAKFKRQIIIVTHDANLVVNGDAEQVIVARYQDQEIDHKQSGALENPDIREAVARILEGGDEAFKRREKKYSFK